MNTQQKMKPMQEVLYIVVHCSATRPSQTWTVDDIDRLHRAKACPSFDATAEYANMERSKPTKP